MTTSLRALCAIITLATGTWCQATTFNLTDLGTAPGANSSSGLGLNEAGVVVGFSNVNGGTDTPTRFSSRRNVDLLRKARQTDATGTAAAINRSGTVAGSFTSKEHPHQTLFLANGKQLSFVEPPNVSLLAVGAINDAGTVIGLGSSNTCQRCGLIYQNGNWTLVPYTEFNAILSDGRMVGAVNLDTDSRAALFEDGNTQVLPDLGGVSSWATGLNAAGDVVGTSFPAGGKAWHAMLIRNGQAIDLNPHGYRESQAVAINDQGWIIGSLNLPAAPGFSEGGKLQDLNHFLSADQQAQWLVTAAQGINNKGQIAGTAVRKSDGIYRAVLLTPLTAR